MDELEKLLARHRQEKAAGKTADQLFADLGYKRLEGVPHNAFSNGAIVIEVCDYVSKWAYATDIPVDFEPQEILACAQLIRELSAPHYPLGQEDPDFIPGVLT